MDVPTSPRLPAVQGRTGDEQRVVQEEVRRRRGAHAAHPERAPRHAGQADAAAAELAHRVDVHLPQRGSSQLHCNGHVLCRHH